jgi:hypothetical protein
VRTASIICSPWKMIHVTPVNGQAMWINHNGNSASSEMRLNAKRVKCQP